MTELEPILTAYGMSSIAQHIPALIALAAALAAILPPATPRSPRWWKTARSVIDKVALNVRNARNK